MAQQSLFLQKAKKKERSRRGGYVARVERKDIATRRFRGQMSRRNNTFVIGNKKEHTAARKRRLFLSTALWKQTCNQAGVINRSNILGHKCLSSR